MHRSHRSTTTWTRCRTGESRVCALACSGRPSVDARCRVEEAGEKVPEREGVPQVDAQISAMEHKEAAYEAQVTFNM